VRWFLFNLSAFLVSSLSIGALCAMKRLVCGVKCSKYAVFYAVPVAALATMPAAVSHYTYTGVFCHIEEVSNAMLAAVIALNFIFTLLAQIYGMREASKTVPDSVLRRSMRIIFRYILAYWLSFGLFILFQLVGEPLQIQSTRVGSFVEILSWRLVLMNGFFNFVALRLHVWEAAFHPKQRVQSSVAFSLSVQVREVNDVNHHTLASDFEMQIQRIRADNLELWDHLGILETHIEEEKQSAEELLQTPQSEMHVEQRTPSRRSFEGRDRPSSSRPKSTEPARSSSWHSDARTPVLRSSERRHRRSSSQSNGTRSAQSSSWHSDARKDSQRGSGPVSSLGRGFHRVASCPQFQDTLEDKNFWTVVHGC